jgi:hypothetical protein
MAVQTLTITRTILGINPIGNNIWQIEFNPAQTQITANSITAPVIYYSSSALPVVLNPYLNNLENWNSSDYNAVINNVDVYRENKFLFDVDYSTNQQIPINYEAIISGSATRATIPESNYTSTFWNRIRYDGSRNTTDGFNNANVGSSNTIQTEQNMDLQPSTLGLAATSRGTSIGLYYYWAGGTDPEVPGATNFQIKFMFDENGNVFTPDISSSYYYDLLYSFPANSYANVIPYNKDGSTTAQNSVQASIQGIRQVFWPGVYFNAYLTSQSGSTVNDDFYYEILNTKNQLGTLSNSYSPTYWFTTASGDTSTLLLNNTIRGVMYNNAGALTNPNDGFFAEYGKEGLYYQITGSDTYPNRRGFDETSLPILPSPYELIYDLSPPNQYFSGSFSPFPDIVRISDPNSATYTYRTVEKLVLQASTTAYLTLRGALSNDFVEANGRVNKVTLLRLVPAPEKLYLNVTKVGGDSGPGFILPANPSQKLIDNFPTIINDLSSKNLI